MNDVEFVIGQIRQYFAGKPLPNGRMLHRGGLEMMRIRWTREQHAALVPAVMQLISDGILEEDGMRLTDKGIAWAKSL